MSEHNFIKTDDPVASIAYNSTRNASAGKYYTNIFENNSNLEAVADTTSFIAFADATSCEDETSVAIRKAEDQELKLDDLVVSFKGGLEIEINGESDEERLARVVKSINDNHGKIAFIITKSNIACASYAYIAGKYLIEAKELFREVSGNSKGASWIRFAKDSFPEISKSSREKYINVASVPCAEKHFVLGVERLSEFGSYLNSLTEKQRAKLGTDPITKMAEQKINLSTPLAENMASIDAFTAFYTLKKRGVNVDWDTLIEVYESGQKILSVDAKHLKYMVEEGKDEKELNKYLRDLIKTNGERANLLGLDSKKKKKTGTKNVDANVSALTKIVDDVLEKEVAIGIDVFLVETLIEKLNTLKAKIKTF